MNVVSFPSNITCKFVSKFQKTFASVYLAAKNEKCGKAITEIPMLAFRKSKRLKDYLVRAKVQKKEW